MASTWGTNVWGANSYSSDVNLASPSSNIISVSVGTAESFSLLGWGGQFWGSEEWGNLFDETVQVTGVTALQLNIGNESVTGEINAGWGGSAWGENGWGIFGDVLLGSQLIQSAVQSVVVTADANVTETGFGLTSAVGNESVQIDVTIIASSQNLTITQGNADPEPDAMATGQALSLSLASVAVTAQIQIGWGGLSWGTGEWGDLANPDVLVTGVSLTPSLGTETITADANVPVTGIAGTVTLQGAVGGTSVDPAITGATMAVSAGSAFAGELVTVQVTSPVSDEWGTEPWGQGLWGVGDGVTIFVGTDHVHIGDANVIPTGAVATGSLGTLGQASIYSFTGAQAAVAQNSVFGGELVIVPVTTASATNWGDAPFGAGQWGQGEGTDISQGGEEVAVPSVEVDVTTVIATTSTGQETIKADANVTLTTAGLLTTSLGDEDAFTNVRVNVTGQALGPIVIGDYLAGISQLVTPTGVTMTVSSGIMSVNAWAVVDAGTEPTWAVVDIAA